MALADPMNAGAVIGYCVALLIIIGLFLPLRFVAAGLAVMILIAGGIGVFGR